MGKKNNIHRERQLQVCSKKDLFIDRHLCTTKVNPNRLPITLASYKHDFLKMVCCSKQFKFSLYETLDLQSL